MIAKKRSALNREPTPEQLELMRRAQAPARKYIPKQSNVVDEFIEERRLEALAELLDCHDPFGFARAGAEDAQPGTLEAIREARSIIRQHVPEGTSLAGELSEDRARVGACE